MIHKIKISIPEPCHEKWSEMTPTEKGRFCSNCQKNVVDFTKSSDREILLEYNRNENLCGQFRASQLDRTLILPKEKKSIWMIAAASIIAFLGLGTQSATAQGNVRIEQTDQKQLSDSLDADSNNKRKEYSGVLLDNQNIPLPSANVVLKGTKIRTQTNFDGKFSIKAKKGDTLIFSYIGFENKEFKLKNKLQIQVKMDIEMMMGEVIIEKKEDYIEF
ncbi:hypothetical protein GON26_11650 [Flavobacterium sp. GA093]|uniref:CarboxypepD_reg-like domain-containing protein n=1 Tax=Flavobacterium hydrocarbonoxydans TaxID=2683249 RepID=A0A6I4NPZ8_9FLAO|nr:carboxypeptidase-like regulatory domain-containing protein [Flavobacterium hydrocarbonoxydans]MWB95022.1 hypothetical protein [Flavobacterium hydrocarbonoxydans]